MSGLGTDGQAWADRDSQKRFKYVGREYENGSLSFTGIVQVTDSIYIREDSTNTWSGVGLANWTPGKPNIGQVMPPAPEPGGAHAIITSVLSLLKGTHNNNRSLTHLVKVRKNESTNIVYTADNWYRLYSIKEDGVERLPLAPTNTFTLNFNNVQANINVYATINAREDVKDVTPDILDWLEGFDDLPLAPTYLNRLYSPTQLTLRERFWIGANPVKTNVFTFLAHANEIHKRPLYLPLEMAVIDVAGHTTNKVRRLQGGSVVQAWASFSIDPPNWNMLIGQFSLTEASFDANNKRSVWINAFTNRPAFFKWRLSSEDPRVATHPLENEPKP